MREFGISRRDFERLPPETKTQVERVLAEMRPRLEAHFSLRFLGLDGRWKDLTAWKFLAQPEEHYERLIRGSKGFRSTTKLELLVTISEMYHLTEGPKKLTNVGLEPWTKPEKS
jgi:hypothetical protein